MGMIVRSAVFGVLLPLCLVAVGIVIGSLVIEQERDSNQQNDKEHLIRTGQLVVRDITMAISDSLNTAWTLAALVMGQDKLQIIDHNSPNISDRMVLIGKDKLEALGSSLKKRFPSVGSFQIQPSAVVTQAYPPLIPGKAPWSHDLLNDKDRRQDIIAGIESRSLMVAGPFPLSQGGIGLLSRYPIFNIPFNNTPEDGNRTSPNLNGWWGMTASLVHIEVLLDDQVSISSFLKEGVIDYCLEYWNPNSNTVEVIRAQTSAFNVSEMNALRKDKVLLEAFLESHDFIKLLINLPGNRLWNLWVRKSTTGRNTSKMALCVVLTTVGALIVSSVYWGPHVARDRLYRTLIIIFEEIVVMNITHDVESRLPKDSPPLFVRRMQQMLEALQIYRSFLPQSLTNDKESVLRINPLTTKSGGIGTPNSELVFRALDSSSACSISPAGCSNTKVSVKAGSPFQPASTGLLLKDASVVVIEAANQLKLYEDVTLLEKEHTKLMQTVTDSLRLHWSGKVYAVTGGSIIVEFNCSRPLASHALASALFAVKVTEGTDGYHAGVSMGKLSCGNLGNPTLMSFVICGPALEEAILLSRYALTVPVGKAIMTESTKNYCAGRVTCAPIDLVRFEKPFGEKVSTLPSVTVFSMLGAPEQGDGEWMYQLTDTEEDKLLRPYVDLWRKCILRNESFAMPSGNFEAGSDTRILIDRLATMLKHLPTDTQITHTVALGS